MNLSKINGSQNGDLKKKSNIYDYISERMLYILAVVGGLFLVVYLLGKLFSGSRPIKLKESEIVHELKVKRAIDAINRLKYLGKGKSQIKKELKGMGYDKKAIKEAFHKMR